MIKKAFYKTIRNRLVYYELDYKEHKDCIIFLNGLSDSIESWSTVKKYLQGQYSTLFIDLIGQGRSCEEETKSCITKVNFKISVEEQAQALHDTWRSLQIRSKFHLVGFSYGGGVAIRFATLFPDLIKNLVLFLPYTIRLDLAFPIQRVWANHIGLLNNFGLLTPHLGMLGNGYQRLIRDYMNFRFSKHIPDENRRKVSMDLTEGIMPFNAFDVFDFLPNKTVHLITAENDSLVPKSLYREIWARLPESRKCSWLNIRDGEHLIFEQAPLYCARWIETTMAMNNSGPSRIFSGTSYKMETVEDICL